MFIVAEGDENFKEVVGCLSNLVAALYKEDNPKIAETVLSDHSLCEEVMLALKKKQRKKQINYASKPIKEISTARIHVNSKCFMKQVQNIICYSPTNSYRSRYVIAYQKQMSECTPVVNQCHNEERWC